MKKTYQGSCHCGAVRFECDLDLADGTSRCNCTFCSKSRMWIGFAKGDAFRLRQGAEVLTDYQHTPPGRPGPFLHLFFCSRCGVRPFAEGGYLEQFGSAFHAVNLGCLDDATDDLAQAPVRFVDGRNNDWTKPPAEHRHL